jgi:hypothetical protein
MGQMGRQRSEAENQVLAAAERWRQYSQMAMESIKPEKSAAKDPKEKRFLTSTFRFRGMGGIGNVINFVAALNAAEIPVRLTEIQLDARREGFNDLNVVMVFATTYFAPETPPRPGAGAGATEARP